MLKILGLIAIGIMMSASAAKPDGVGLVMRESRLPAIRSIDIQENAARSPAATASENQCGHFVQTKAEVRLYLRSAREVTQGDYLHMLDWSPCYASGNVQFADGRTATWGIQQMRAGSLTFRNGSIAYLYCPNCRARAFEISPDEFGLLRVTDSLAADVQKFVLKRQDCDHFRGEIPEPKQWARMREAQREIRRLCTGTDKQLGKLKKKYATDARIMETLNEFEADIEGLN